MPNDPIRDFRLGLDARKFFLSASVGSLTSAINCHVTQGGELEKRKALVNVPIPSPYTSRTFGIQSSPNGIYLFGAYTIIAPSFQRTRTANVATVNIPNTTVAAGLITAGTHINVSGLSGVGYNLTNVAVSAVLDDGTYLEISYPSTGPDETLTTDFDGRVIRTADVMAAPFIYQVLIHPSYSAAGAGLLSPVAIGVVYSTLFGSFPFVLAQFSDGAVIPYYNGLYLNEAALGLEFFGTDSGGDTMLDRISNYIDTFLTAYTATESGSVLDLFSVPTSLNGTPYTATVDVTSIGGAMVAEQQTTGQASTLAAQPVASFQIVKAGNGTQATGTLTNSTDANMVNNETVVVGSITYTFKNSVSTANDVKIGASRDITMGNFAAAINASGTPGTTYGTGTVANPTVKCSGLNNTTTTGPTTHYTVALAAITGGAAGNAILLGTSSSSNLVHSATTLLGGVDSKINQIVVNGATNLLVSPVAFSTDETTFASAVVLAINSNPPSGFSASSNGATINIFTQVAGATDNGFPIQVQSQGTVICGTGAFSLTGSGFTMDFCRANGVDLMNNASPYLVTNTTVLTYPLVPGQVLSDFCRVVANSINSGTASHGYSAFCAQGSVSLYVYKATSTSNDPQQVLDIGVTASGGQTGSAIPVTITPLTVTLSINVIAIGIALKSQQVTAQVAGGLAPYTYVWVQQGSNVIGITPNRGRSPTTSFSSVVNITIQEQVRAYNRLSTSSQKAFYLANHPALKAYLDATQTNQVAFVCVVTDTFGEVATSDPVYVTLLGQ